MARKTKEKAITKEIQGLLKKMGINLKFQACSHCQTEIVDMEGHNKLMHLSDLTKAQIFRKNGVRCFLHCPICLPSAKVFRDKQALLNHLKDAHRDM